jgi:phosphoribosylaminoimidazolecarboxamide formyltransferase / IMP cyclohydrolase
MFKRALVSVSDKSGLVEFLRPLADQGLQIVSSGGTADFLRNNNFQVVDVKDQTGFPEVMGGRVKTLHPKIHMSLLYRDVNDQDAKLLSQYEIEPFDLVVVNLYPFESSLKQNLSEPEMIEKIDVGGPSMLRGAAKNFKFITSVCSPEDYKLVLDKVLNKSWSIEDRKKLAAKVFDHLSCYDRLISDYLLGEGETSSSFRLFGKKVSELRYGENPHQKSSWYSYGGNTGGWENAKIIQGKALSYNNLLDLQASLELINNLSDLSGSAVVAVKHNNPCGVAIDSSAFQALQKALAADPVSVFGGIVGVNFKIEKDHAQLLNSIFLECIWAPSFSDEALSIFAQKKNLRVLQLSPSNVKDKTPDIKSIFGGFLLQEKDQDFANFDEVTDFDLKKNLQFAERVCAALKSNSIAIIGNGQTLGLGMGQVNRVDAVQQSILRWQSFHKDKNNVVLASDAFFPFVDSIEIAAQAGVKFIVQPGGSIKDEEVVHKANDLGIKMFMTGKRHFKH